ncbi:MEKHLA domain-containing protein [Aestuariispira insulae]|uniref:MEKHLA domain-containing protein n=1 Tax=Aestuariispira insulae TaxID=1461337 RepID=A0A3D9HGP3_9PROT|nr:MEKHLA domain-containing protein [Aestuariispira insulae]RED48659.1 MEKHLA domain-containing protein [Aestuariispira insulae]
MPVMDIPAPIDWLEAHSRCLADSYRHWTGKGLIDPGDIPLATALWQAPYILVSHNGASDPILNYGNRAALDLWQMDWLDFTKTPSRYTAEPDKRAARHEMLARAGESGLITDYSGIRISSRGQRFMIRQATIWTLLAQGAPCGQAAMFHDWDYL